MTIYFIGIDGEKVVSSKETRNQIEKVKALKCGLQHEVTGTVLTWEVFDGPKEPQSLFRAIERDRMRRVDNGEFMVNRPAFAVVTEENGVAVRLEYYEGRDYLSLCYDIRSESWKDKKVAPYHKGD